MEDFFKDDEFAQFIVNEYMDYSDMTDDENLEQVDSSMEEFAMAVECFKLNFDKVSKH